ncbi:thioredoxin family protein [Pedobacter sp. PF22-3]|uniref:thioredoxin family protein n=1 Tax=Pedobacter sp. PF22-3 TaxID=2994467 RepID=UPI002245EC74|nr:thioredoxin family protein [Pedobacter sp. PF22-3]MCX2494542.1 thioredoxin family protein [Pedobacter sp. PF22-3]
MKNIILYSFFILFISSAFKPDTPPASADVILTHAIAKAKKEKKYVFVLFHASWCGWCHKMDDSMNDPEIKAYFEKSYIIEHLTVLESKGKENLENPGAAELLKKYKSDGFGIPVWFIFDTNGKLIVDSHLRPKGTGLEVKGQNIIGCPASKEEVKAFTDALKKTSKLNDAELAKIAERFRKNDPKYKG